MVIVNYTDSERGGGWIKDRKVFLHKALYCPWYSVFFQQTPVPIHSHSQYQDICPTFEPSIALGHTVDLYLKYQLYANGNSFR